MTRNRFSSLTIAMAVAFCVISATPVTLFAQGMEITVTPTVSYMWAGSYQTLDGDIKLEDGIQYGAILGFGAARNVRAELSWSMLSSRATFAPYYNNIGTSSPLMGLDIAMAVHYFQLGAVHYVDKGKVQPFIGMTAGAVLFHPEDVRIDGYASSDTWRFAICFVGGLTFNMSEKVGLRIQGRLNMPIYFSGAYVGVGTGGASVGATGGVPIVQGDIGAGLSIKI
jgi:hypothetical protein